MAVKKVNEKKKEEGITEEVSGEPSQRDNSAEPSPRDDSGEPKVYENALKIEFRKEGLSFQNQVPIKVYYKNEIVGDYFADFVIVYIILHAEGRLYTLMLFVWYLSRILLILLLLWVSLVINLPILKSSLISRIAFFNPFLIWIFF